MPGYSGLVSLDITCFMSQQSGADRIIKYSHNPRLLYSAVIFCPALRELIPGGTKHFLTADLRQGCGFHNWAAGVTSARQLNNRARTMNTVLFHFSFSKHKVKMWAMCNCL